jgi:hypothetical protein
MTLNLELGYHKIPYHSGAYHSKFNLASDGAQFDSKHVNQAGSQFFASISGNKFMGVQFGGFSNVGHTNCSGFPGYHSQAYHSLPYHAARTCAGIGAQFRAVKTIAFGAQIRAAIYNITNLRVLCDFPSRGDGDNWTASSTKASTTDSFNANNLNTDIVEQIWRTADAVKTGVTVDADAGAGKTIFLDTMAFLNHNLTTSAVVNLLESDNPGHAPIGQVTVLIMTEDNFVYVSPDLPVTGYRYQRIAIDDPTNPNDFLSIGTIVFGNAQIFAGECFVSRVRKTPVNFSDSINTEAFTNVQNDRGIKNKIRLEFKNIRFNGPNFKNLNDDVFETARTILKCLWIPTPQFALRFMTFAKMTKIPDQIHNVRSEDNDLIDFLIETDESK